MKNRSTKTIKKTLFILSGDYSSDNYGANLIYEIKKIDNEIDFLGIGGKNMEKAGLNNYADLNKIYNMGFYKVIKNLFYYLQLKNIITKKIIDTKPFAIICIDYPGFNLRLSKSIKKNKAISSIPMYYYICPQVWAWGKHRLKTLTKNFDSLISILPFEKIWYEKNKLEIQYFGHPIMDNKVNNKSLVREKIVERVKTVGFFPGSRLEEIKIHLPIFIKVIKNIKDKNIKFIISIVPHIPKKIFKKYLDDNIIFSRKTSKIIFSRISFAVMVSGSITMEALFYKIPGLVVYRTNWIDWIIIKLITNIKFIAMPNIINNSMLFPELHQWNVNHYNIKKYIIKQLKLKNNLNNICFDQCLQQLGEKGVSKSVAKYILSK